VVHDVDPGCKSFPTPVNGGEGFVFEEEMSQTVFSLDAGRLEE
jgi:hypothetical protein